ncbi:MAG: hypothetical protein SF029_09740, partial [bacterium]|nr:hypothetical protein [bacterium]
MAAWRRKALEAFPDLKTSLNDSQYSPYSLFSDLLPRWRSAHDTGDETTLEAIYDYAAWCMAQSASELWNAAGVSFYEHLFDQPQHWEVVIAYFSSDAGREICRSVSGLW